MRPKKLLPTFGNCKSCWSSKLGFKRKKKKTIACRGEGRRRGRDGGRKREGRGKGWEGRKERERGGRSRRKRRELDGVRD